MDWKYNVSQYGGGHNNISFQVKLYETTDIIEFAYNQEGGPLATCPGLGCGSASIGLAGANTGDYYSLDSSNAAPLASKTVNTMDIYTKPVSGQIYQWTPVSATGINSALSTENMMSIYPSPVSDKVHITFINDGNNSSSHAEVFDMIGQKLVSKDFLSQKGKNNIDIDMSSLPKGLYMININNSKSVKFAKE
jgi:hypothetical protein